MKCPECGGAELIPGVRTRTFRYRGRELTYEMRGDFCPLCDEGVLSNEESDRLDAVYAAFRSEVNASLADPGYVQAVRKKLGLSQKDAGELFGGGVNAFSRYERVKAVPPQPLLVLFRLLDSKPELLQDILTARDAVPPVQAAQSICRHSRV